MTPIIGMILAAVGVALANKMLKGSIWPSTNSTKASQESKDKIIEVDDYEILD